MLSLTLRQLETFVAIRYQKAIPAPRAFLTTGRRWLILDERGDEILEFDESSGTALVNKLRPIIAKGAINGQLQDPSIWAYGINPSSKRD